MNITRSIFDKTVSFEIEITEKEKEQIAEDYNKEQLFNEILQKVIDSGMEIDIETVKNIAAHVERRTTTCPQIQEAIKIIHDAALREYEKIIKEGFR